MKVHDRISSNKKTKAPILYLDLDGASKLPQELAECVWLEELHLTDNFWLEDISALEKLNNLQRLNISGARRITDLLPFKNIRSLQILNLSGSGISNLLPIENLINLKELSFSYTKVEDLSPLVELKNLQKLFAYETKIQDLLALKNLSQLKAIYIFQTQVQSLLPLQNLNRLQTLNAYHTQVQDLSPLRKIKSLESLDISYTKVFDLSPLKNLNNLQTLDVSGTNVCDLSPILPLLRRGEGVDWIECEGNIGYVRVLYCPLTTPPQGVVRAGNVAVLNYFDQLEKDGIDHIYEAKLLLIGEGGAGKTTLCRKLFDPKASLPREVDSTRGIDIKPLYFNRANGKPFRLNIWDFAGQGKYQSAHSFFYTHRSLYILVDDTRTLDENEAYRTFYHHWLQTAELFGGNSPLLVLHNQKSDRPRTGFNLGNFQAEFPFVKELFRINLGGDATEGIFDLKTQIERWAQKLPHIGDVVPKTWVKVREDIETEKQLLPYISDKRYRKICAKHGITDEAKQSVLSHYFHDLGVLLHFQDNPLLRRDVFLQNQWVTDAVYKILDDAEISGRQRGRFDKTDLARLWNEGFYSKRRDELLALMLQFELCYQVQDTETYIAPQLLPGDIPAYNLGTDIPLQLKYEYGFMPKGLLYRLIVRLHRLIGQGQLAVWNSGAVLERADAQADVLESLDRRQISVRATGTRAKELVTIVAEKLDELHATFGDRLKVEVKIPCNCRICKASSTPHFYDKKDLENRLIKGKSTVECRESFDDVNVQGLLDGVFTNIVNNPIDLLQIGEIRAALEKLRPNPKAIELLAQFTHAETEYKYGRIEYQAFRGEQSRIVAAAMDLVK